MTNPLRPPLVALLLCFLLAPARAALPASAEGQPLPTLAPMLERVMGAVVNVSTVTRIETADHPLLRDPFFRHFFELPRQERRESNSLGSGVIVDAEQGIALTNHHVIAKAESIRVTLQDGRTLDADLLGADPETDVAVLRLPTRGLPAGTLRNLPMADSDALRVGDFVVAIGNPFGLKQTVTSGIVSGLGRSGLGIEGYESFIQTDASINPGNSGGPLVNLRGELVGINTAILAPGGGNIGIGFAIPTNMARAVMEQVLRHGRIRRGEFGVSVQELTPELAAALGIEGRSGALVTAVEPGSAAAESGLREGDLVVALDGRPIGGAADIRTRFGLLPVGAKVTLEVLRDGRTLTLKGEIADPYRGFVPGEQVAASLAGALLGEVRDGTPAVQVGTVNQDSPARTSGLQEGDRILSVNGERVQGLTDLARLARRAGRIQSLSIQRGDRLIVLSRR
ncbi:MAG: Do family serine endopeptidase [Bdellovibrio bacteriovorus]